VPTRYSLLQKARVRNHRNLEREILFAATFLAHGYESIRLLQMACKERIDGNHMNCFRGSSLQLTKSTSHMVTIGWPQLCGKKPVGCFPTIWRISAANGIVSVQKPDITSTGILEASMSYIPILCETIGRWHDQWS